MLAEETAAGEVRWALSDHQGSVRDLIDSDGAVLNHIVYDSYGQVTSETNPDVDFRFGYTGRERDEETGLYYYRARYFDPAPGTFVSTDPLGFGAGDSNLYRYVFNSPTNYTDPSGKFALTASVVGFAAFAIAGIGITLWTQYASRDGIPGIDGLIQSCLDALEGIKDPEPLPSVRPYMDGGYDPSFDPNYIPDYPTEPFNWNDLIRSIPPSDFGLADGLGGFGKDVPPNDFFNPPGFGEGLGSISPEDFVFDINFGKHLKKLKGDPPKGMVDPHAHHILYKKGRGAKQQELVREGQEILERAGIDPILGPENLVWAPNRVSGQHRIDDARDIVKKMKEVEAAGGDKDDLAEVLEQFGQKAAQRQ